MKLLNSHSVNTIELARTHSGHMNSDGRTNISVGENRNNKFEDMVANAIGKVSDKQLEASKLFERMITHPDEVEPHDVTIAIAQAEMSLKLTKNIVDRAVKAYKDITAMR